MTNTIGRYKIASMIGRGGMATVYKAVDPYLDRNVAVKIIAKQSGSVSDTQAETIRQGLSEARLSSRLIHPNIVITHDAGFENGKFYITLEYLDGVALSSFVENEVPLEKQKAVEYVFNVCHALDYIHGKGLVHLDVKPSNIMLTRLGEIKLMDFGIARLLKNKPKKEGLDGSAPYMSPEQIGDTSDAQAGSKSNIDHRSDIFSLGVVLYELLTGKKPFQGEGIYQVMYQVLNKEPEPVSHFSPEISPELDTVVKTAMNKNPDNRFKTVKEFADALLVIIKGNDSRTLSSQEKKRVAALRQLIFFQHFQFAHLSRILEISTWHFFPKDAYILEEHENDSNIYIIISGRALLMMKETVSFFTPGDCFCESSILFQKPRQTKLKAVVDCVVMSINAHILNKEDPALQINFLKEFYRKKTRQLVHANLNLIQSSFNTNV